MTFIITFSGAIGAIFKVCDQINERMSQPDETVRL
jgi:hypothetical protein